MQVMLRCKYYCTSTVKLLLLEYSSPNNSNLVIVAKFVLPKLLKYNLLISDTVREITNKLK